MRAAVTEAPGGPVHLRELADPTPAVGEILVRVHAASANRLDATVFEGQGLGRMAAFPLVQGIDAAGIVEVGDPTFKRGTRVVVKPTAPCGTCRACEAGREADCARPSILGVHRQGGFAELVAVPAAGLAVIPEALSFEQAASAAHVHPVVLRMIRTADLAPSETVLVTGGAGALGSAAVQLATALGARVIATCSTEAKAEVVRTLGGEAIVVGDDVDAALLALIGDNGVDIVLDSTGNSAVAAAAATVLARGGRYVVAGTHAGATLTLDLSRLYLRRQRIIGSASATTSDFADAFGLIAQHGITPLVGATFELSETEAALNAVLDRDRVGKVVVRID